MHIWIGKLNLPLIRMTSQNYIFLLFTELQIRRRTERLRGRRPCPPQQPQPLPRPLLRHGLQDADGLPRVEHPRAVGQRGGLR